MSRLTLEQRVAAVRAFNRFYTRRIGVLNEGLYQSPFSLTESRVLYELAHRRDSTATQLGKELGLDPGYLSRILRRFEKTGLLARATSTDDGRQNLLSLTRKGRATFAPLDAHSRDEVNAMLCSIPEPEQDRLIGAMRTIQDALEGEQQSQSAYLLRQHQPGDMGWVIHRHGVLYAQEYGYDEHFEALVAEIAAHFIQNYDPKRERCWIAEKDGQMVGCVFLVKQSKAVAKLRLLLVEPSARGLGIGGRLVDECARFARQCGYRKIVLWTQSELRAARHIYQKAGFHLLRRQPHRSWGRKLVAETWELKL
jgi:DNA-binding MarR family transcriptional regulator/N-acetylglutamate synthase-like GNAT family acetyltransferase